MLSALEVLSTHSLQDSSPDEREKKLRSIRVVDEELGKPVNNPRCLYTKGKTV